MFNDRQFNLNPYAKRFKKFPFYKKSNNQCWMTFSVYFICNELSRLHDTLQDYMLFNGQILSKDCEFSITLNNQLKSSDEDNVWVSKQVDDMG